LATVTTTANRLPPSGHQAAGLTMILSMNAMVCGDMNHGERLAVHDHLKRSGWMDKRVTKRGAELLVKKFKDRTENVGPSIAGSGS
jgi:hypothetical protein